MVYYGFMGWCNVMYWDFWEYHVGYIYIYNGAIPQKLTPPTTKVWLRASQPPTTTVVGAYFQHLLLARLLRGGRAMLRIREDATVKTTDSSEILMPGVTQEKSQGNGWCPSQMSPTFLVLALCTLQPCITFLRGKGSLSYRSSMIGKKFAAGFWSVPSTIHHQQSTINKPPSTSDLQPISLHILIDS